MKSHMAQRRTLTEQQVSILRWIDDGCPADDEPSISRRISAAALRRRGLVSISGRGRSWSARLTADGRNYLKAVEGPDPPIPRQPSVSVTQQLVDQVVAAGGTLRVPRKRWSDRSGVDYAHRARLAERHRKVPVGKRLAVKPNGDELEICLLDAPELTNASALTPVPVPSRVASYHETARCFRDHRDRHEVSRALLGRATRIVHAMAVEAERRGWEATAPEASGERLWSG